MYNTMQYIGLIE